MLFLTNLLIALSAFDCVEPPSADVKADGEKMVETAKPIDECKSEIKTDSQKREIKVSMEQELKLPEKLTTKEIASKFKAIWFEKPAQPSANQVKIIKQEEDPIAQVEYQEVPKGESEVQYSLVKKVALTRLAGPYAVKTLQSSQIVLSIIRQDDESTTVKISIAETSRHPGGLADFRLTDKDFFKNVEKETKESFDSDIERVRKSMASKPS